MFEIGFQTGQTIFRFKLNFKISKLYLRLQINSNGFSRDRSFGHKTYSFSYHLFFSLQLLNWGNFFKKLEIFFFTKRILISFVPKIKIGFRTDRGQFCMYRNVIYHRMIKFCIANVEKKLFRHFQSQKILISYQSHVENFCLLKIHLKLFEIPNQILKFENLI